jgi:hypothetical protein
MKRELRSSDFAFLLLIYFLLCSGRGRSRDSGSNRRSTSSPPKGPFGSLPLRRTRVLWCWCPPFGTKFTPTATPVAYGTCGAGASLRHVRPCAARRGRRAPAVVVVQAALPRGWRWLTPSPERLKWKCGLRRLKGSVPPRIDWLLSITTTFSASSSTFRYAHHYYILLHF